ncbi:MAG TPA: hypothetical protein VMP68_28910 [Candidatus Eisenbacteria bacterium]|nr:hypothetical protein [Candidatus Eisenbacteria bacterium]
MRSTLMVLAFTVVLTFQTSVTRGASDNLELSQMYKLDQSEREGANVDWRALYRHDTERRARLKELLQEGKVQSATDYFHAGMIYQHGQTPDDYLLAHLLAVTAISKGSKDARWLSAATMDRYLRSIWQPQVYGTQFSKSSDKEPWSHESMNKDLVSDSMRAAVCVVALSKQMEDLSKAGTRGVPGRTSVEDCD